MEWTETPESSNISRFGYVPETQSLVVEFKSGATYEYFDVAQGLYEAMVAAASRGSFLAQAIKGTHRYARR